MLQGDYFVCTLLRSGRVYYDNSKIIDFPGSTMGRHLLAVSAHCGQVPVPHVFEYFGPVLRICIRFVRIRTNADPDPVLGCSKTRLAFVLATVDPDTGVKFNLDRKHIA
jgi:hypothetical protein